MKHCKVSKHKKTGQSINQLVKWINQSINHNGTNTLHLPSAERDVVSELPSSSCSLKNSSFIRLWCFGWLESAEDRRGEFPSVASSSSGLLRFRRALLRSPEEAVGRIAGIISSESRIKFASSRITERCCELVWGIQEKLIWSNTLHQSINQSKWHDKSIDDSNQPIKQSISAPKDHFVHDNYIPKSAFFVATCSAVFPSDSWNNSDAMTEAPISLRKKKTMSTQ